MFFRFPNGILETGKESSWEVYKFKAIPCTPSGDFVAAFSSKEDADKAAHELTRDNCTLEEAKARFT